MRDIDPTASEYITSGFLEQSDRHYDPVSILTAVAPSIIGGVMGKDASSSAGDAQAASADKATELQRQMFERQVALQEPFRQGGLAAQNKLLSLMGIRPQGMQAQGTQMPMQGMQQPFHSGNTGGMMRSDGVPNMLQAGSDGVYSPQPGPQQAPEDTNSLRARLAPQFTTQGQGGISNANGSPDWMPGQTSVDEQGLQAAMQQAQGQQVGQQQPMQAQAEPSTDPEFGSLMKTFGNDQFQADGAPKLGNFTPEAFQAGMDPGYAFRQQQGEQGLQRLAAARGGLGSGGAMKDAMTFNQGLASQEFGNAFNRFQTNRANTMGDYTGAFNRFQSSNAAKLNPLQSLMGSGQSSANQVGQAGANYATQAGSNMMGAGNARAAGMVGGANAMSNAIGQGYNNFQTNQLMSKLNFGGGTPTSGLSNPGYDAWQTSGNGMPSGYN